MKKLIVVVLFGVMFSSCEKVFFKKDVATTNAYENFDYLWKELDTRYAYFDYKNIDWNATKDKYRARLFDGMREDSLFRVMGDMLNELRDGHVNLISPFNISVFDVELLGPDNIDDRVILENYIGTDRLITGPFTHNFLRNKEIGYIRFRSFPGTVDSIQLDYILDRYKDTKGLVFDIRQNGGGVINDAYTILCRFIDQQTFVYQSQGKSGPAHDAFDAPVKSYLTPAGKVKYLKKIVVLTDRGTYSSGSFFTVMAHAIDNMIVVGDTTGGGLGLPNGGQLPNGWTYRCSITRTLDIKGNNYENGVPPNKVAFVDKARLAMGIDDVLETAMKEIQ